MDQSLYRRDQKKALSAINLGALNYKIGKIDQAKNYLSEGVMLAKKVIIKKNYRKDIIGSMN